MTTSRTTATSTPKYWWTRILRKPRICGQAISGCALETSAGNWFAADDLQISLDGVLGHVDEIRRIVVQCADVPTTSIDRLEDVADPLIDVTAYNATASS